MTRHVLRHALSGVAVVRGPRPDVPWLGAPGLPTVAFDPDEEIEVVGDDGPRHVIVRLAGRTSGHVRVLRTALDAACGREPVAPPEPPPHNQPRRRNA